MLNFIRILFLLALLAGGAYANNSFDLHAYHSEQGWYYGCDPDHLEGRLFKNYRNGKELF